VRGASWFRGLRLRIFALTALVALAAVGVTAWLTLRETTGQVNSTTTARRDATERIYRELSDYALLHGTWEGVAETVQSLAARTGQRIRLLATDGFAIVDTAAGTPATTFGSPSAVLTAVPNLRIPNTVLPDTGAGTAPPPPLDNQVWDALVSYRYSVLLAACLTRGHLPIRRGADSPWGVPRIEPGPLPTSMSADAPAQCLSAERAGAGVADFSRIFACHGRVQCLYEAFHDLAAQVAPAQLLLYVGDVSTHIRRRPVFLGAALVALVTVGIALLVSQRVLRPIGTLNRAATGLARGDLSARVPLRGRDELAELARTFNRMADSLQRSENRQRQMIADIAHELRTPLANVRGYLEALRDGILAPDPELFASLHEEAMLQQRIVDDLQDLALAESGAMVYQWVPLDVRELLHTCATAHRATAEAAGVSLQVVEPDEQTPLRVRADADRLRQVLGNLITNALRATPTGGAVTLGARMDASNSVVITVRDTGTGMSAEQLPLVFDRFWRADTARARATGGTGLGLAIAREIITAHGGTIDITSAPDLGTTATVRLPAANGA
jgi:two-component system sensor histidine kinase BaeS